MFFVNDEPDDEFLYADNKVVLYCKIDGLCLHDRTMGLLPIDLPPGRFNAK